MNDEPRQIPSRGLSRRSFLVSVGSFILGSFVMPDPLLALSANELQASTKGEDCFGQRIRRLIGRPVKSKNGRVLGWLEEFEDGQPHVMVWELETDQELEEGRRFFEIANWRTWNSREELETILAADPGPWLIRRNFGETYSFFMSDDLNYLMSDNFILSPDPNEGVQVSSQQALRLVVSLMPVYGGGVIYIEPVKPADALRNFRAETFRLQAS